MLLIVIRRRGAHQCLMMERRRIIRNRKDRVLENQMTNEKEKNWDSGEETFFIIKRKNKKIDMAAKKMSSPSKGIHWAKNGLNPRLQL